MAPRYSLSFILIICLSRNECTNDLSRVKVIEMAEKLCTGQDLCSTNTSQISVIREASICCFDCSCDPRCIENENCCFPDQAYPIGNRDADDEHERSVIENDTTLVYECLYPSSPQPTDVLGKIRQQSIWMISKILNKYNVSKYQKCGHRKVAPWGSFLPVSSKKTGYIYKNIVCAKEHGVKEEDVVVWKGSIICNKRGIDYRDLGEAKLIRCQKRFYAHSGIEIKSSSLCFNNFVDTCPEMDFTIPTDLDMNSSEVIKACTSGFLSPYRSKGMFANVFCHICNGYLPERNQLICTNLSVYFVDGRLTNSITGLLNFDYLQSLSGDKNEKQDLRLACIGKDIVLKPVAGTCRIIQCPVGQIRNNAGKCLFGTLQWSNVAFKLCIQLTSDKPFNIRHYLPDTSSSWIDDLSNLVSPFPKSIKIESIFYKPLMSLNDTDEILISVASSGPITSIKMFINEVKKGIKKTWLLLSQNTTISLKAKMARENFNDRRGKFMSGFGKKYQRIYYISHDYFTRRPIYLSKLYFCDNVQLESSEYDISKKEIIYKKESNNIFDNDDTDIVQNKISNRSLYNAEFSLVKLEQTVSCRVCLEDSGFIADEHDKSVGNSLSLGLLMILGCFSTSNWLKNIFLVF